MVGTHSQREEVEELFFREAALLDEWRLEEWLGLLTDDVCYYVPTPGAGEKHADTTIFLVADDAVRVRSRAKQLLGMFAHAEIPRSRTRRLISNVRIREIDGDVIRATANFAVYRTRHHSLDTFVGRYEYTLVRQNGELKIRERKAILDRELLEPQGALSIVL